MISRKLSIHKPLRITKGNNTLDIKETVYTKTIKNYKGKLELMFMKHYAPNRCLYIKVAKLRTGVGSAVMSHLQNCSLKIYLKRALGGGRGAGGGGRGRVGGGGQDGCERRIKKVSENSKNIFFFFFFFFGGGGGGVVELCGIRVDVNEELN